MMKTNFFKCLFLCFIIIKINNSEGYDVRVCTGCTKSLNNRVQCFGPSEEVDCAICGCRVATINCSGMCCFNGSCDFKKGVMNWTCPKNKVCYNVNCAKSCR
ncbi:uncharacterized protein LOC101237482 [Hydra vulgaris]|uniref:Uncharacterized protein LOC101237482 n=1 Tax=Hydra vulgaris TaxID=6087 RepID=A0ABM4CIY3_HYDVU